MASAVLVQVVAFSKRVIKAIISLSLSLSLSGPFGLRGHQLHGNLLGPCDDVTFAGLMSVEIDLSADCDEFAAPTIRSLQSVNVISSYYRPLRGPQLFA